MKRIISICIVLVIATSCANENWIWGWFGNSGCIGVNVSNINSPSTRSEASGERHIDSFVVDTIGSEVLRMDVYVSDFAPEDYGVETKGRITNTGNINEFWMNAYANDDWYDHETGTEHTAGLYFDNIKTVTESDGVWSIADSPRWLNGVDMTFWSRAGEIRFATPSPLLTPSNIDLADNKASISYTNNGHNDLIYAFNKEKRVFDNNTGKITGGTGTYKSGARDAMDVHFYHALSVIRFDISGLKNNGLTIKKVTVCGVSDKATCAITADPETEGNPLDFVWTLKTSISNYSVPFNAATDFTETGVDGITPNALMSWESSKFLFLIPQEVEGQGITIELVYEDTSGTEVTSTTSLNHSEPWVAGKYYTYKLSINESEVSIIVDDEVSATLKSNVSIKNDGSKSAFVRASIVAYWMDADGNYLLGCDYKNQGTIVGLATGNWQEKSDGFFYYNGEVAVGADIGPSFLTSYAPPAAPMTGATLRMIITAQAIEYDSEKTCYDAFNN